MKKMKDRKMQSWIQKMTVVLLALVLVLGIPASARAEGGVLVIDPEREDCSITLTLEYKDNGESKELQGGELSLYTVASVKVENGYHFDVTNGKFADEEGVSGISSMTSKELSKVNFELAQKLEKQAAKAEADRCEKIAGGEVSFTGLKPGLYLIVQTRLSEGERKVNSFLISVPDEEGNFRITGAPKPGVFTPEKETETEQPPKQPSEKLPQTGQLWWPVPVMAIAGAAFLAAGIVSKKKKKA